MGVEGGVTKYFAWAGRDIIAEYEAWGANALVWKKSYVYLGGQLLATTSGADGAETRFHHPDRLGTRLVTDAGGTVVTEQLSMPFGTMLPFTQTYGGENSYQHPTLSNPSKKRFTTYDRSDATGLDYAVNRFYSSQQGRFTQVDPIEMDAASLSDPQTLNLYAYCGNDPINNLDPDGLFWGAIGRFFKAIGKALLSIFTSGSGASSGPDFRTPPTFPGSLPGINAAIRSGMGGFRTPPFVSGFLHTSSTAIWDAGVGAVGMFLQMMLAAISAAQGGTAELLKSPCPPTAEQLMKHPVVRKALNTAMKKSGSFDPSLKNPGTTPNDVHEEGGWIYWNSKTNKIDTRMAPPGKSMRETGDNHPHIYLGNPPNLGGDWMLVANFHTHPLLNWDLRNGSDHSRALNNGVPNIIKQGREVGYVGPDRAGSNPIDARNPLPGYPGKTLDTRHCK